jgi:hypothetical protein
LEASLRRAPAYLRRALDTNATTPFAIRRELNYFLRMPTEVSIPDAEDLKSRARELRRFL